MAVTMLIPTAHSKVIRKYEGVLFYSSLTLRAKHQLAYRLFRPLLGWAKKEIEALGLESDEAESEIFLLCMALFKYHDNARSSIIPYLEKQLPWRAANMLKAIKKTLLQETSVGLTTPEPIGSAIQEEFYLKTPDILFLHNWIGKCFTNGEKYLIYRILVTDDAELSQQKLATASGMRRKRMNQLLSDIREVFSMEEFYE